MKKTVLCLVLFLLPLQVLAVSNFKVNGQSQFTITTLPVDLVYTCDLAGTGNEAELELYLDANGNGVLEKSDMVMEFYVLTDGIGWIRDPDNPDDDLPGDETGVDGKLRITRGFDNDDIMLTKGNIFLKLTDEDGSSASVMLTLNVQLQPPLIQGRVTDAASGAPVANIIISADGVLAGGEEESAFSISDASGEYVLGVEPGTWKVSVIDFITNTYAPSDTVTVPIGAGETKTQNFSLKKYDSFVQGTLTKEDGTPVPGIRVIAGDIADQNFSMTVSDDAGQYKLGVEPGQVVVGVNILFNMDGEWPENHYVEPETDTLNVTSGQIVTRDFVFKPYTSFITGRCTADGQPLAGVVIQGMVIDLMQGIFTMATTVSDASGNYTLGVPAGMVSLLSATKEGYEVVSPATPYMQITVAEGQTVGGKDFELKVLAGGLSISGRVTYGGDAAAADVYVVARESDAENRNGFRIQYTDGNGQYRFDNLMEGYWQVGVFKAGYSSEPAMWYDYVYLGYTRDDADFMLSLGTGVGALTGRVTPESFQLMQNYPNPFSPGLNGATQIRYILNEAAPAELMIYNVQGQLVRRLVQGSLSRGSHAVSWDGRDSAGQLLPSGTYFYHLKAGSRLLSRRMVIVR